MRLLRRTSPRPFNCQFAYESLVVTRLTSLQPCRIAWAPVKHWIMKKGFTALEQGLPADMQEYPGPDQFLILQRNGWILPEGRFDMTPTMPPFDWQLFSKADQYRQYSQLVTCKPASGANRPTESREARNRRAARPQLDANTHIVPQAHQSMPPPTQPPPPHPPHTLPPHTLPQLQQLQPLTEAPETYQAIIREQSKVIREQQAFIHGKLAATEELLRLLTQHSR